ncbi:MAG: GTPase Era [Proteobacteria bacterium]|nr:GTPase Era [Pseudomonadota bacterium]
MSASPAPPTRAGTVAICGRPNVGKSTLLNAVVGVKLAIVSPQPQTTRNRILAVKTSGDAQLVLVDTPGIHRRRAGLNRFMVREALASLDGVDCVLLVTEIDPRLGKDGAREPERRVPEPTAAAEALLHPEDRYVLATIRAHVQRAPLVLAINKIDQLADRRALLPMIEGWRQLGIHAIVPISALQQDGVDGLVAELAAALPEGPHLYPEDMLTDRAERFLAAEFIRERVLRHTRQEVPHATAVEIERFDERRDRGDVVIAARIYVERVGQRAILIGAGGQQIKRIGSEARQEIANLLGCPVHLKLEVAVADDWTHSASGRQRFGYE